MYDTVKAGERDEFKFRRERRRARGGNKKRERTLTSAIIRIKKKSFKFYIWFPPSFKKDKKKQRMLVENTCVYTEVVELVLVLTNFHQVLDSQHRLQWNI